MKRMLLAILVVGLWGGLGGQETRCEAQTGNRAECRPIQETCQGDRGRFLIGRRNRLARRAALRTRALPVAVPHSRLIPTPATPSIAVTAPAIEKPACGCRGRTGASVLVQDVNHSHRDDPQLTQTETRALKKLCPGLLRFRSNHMYFYDAIDCDTGKILPITMVYNMVVPTGCNAAGNCNNTIAPVIVFDEEDDSLREQQIAEFADRAGARISVLEASRPGPETK